MYLKITFYFIIVKHTKKLLIYKLYLSKNEREDGFSFFRVILYVLMIPTTSNNCCRY